MASTPGAHPVVSPSSRFANTVLLVEDDLDIARMYRLKLEGDGYGVHVAMTGEAGLMLARRWRPRLPAPPALAMECARSAAVSGAERAMGSRAPTAAAP